MRRVFDGSEDDGLSVDDVEPGAATAEDVALLQTLIERAQGLKSSADPKLKALKAALKGLLGEGYRPVVFCRYIATAEYLGVELAKMFKDREVAVVTGELTPQEREQKIEALKVSDKPPLLIATDCLSEGMNLQEQFTSVVHYDLSWNPTRHEQREGRVDRFGQRADDVKALMLYGEDNPVDGAVLQVIIRKADRIRKALGISVPMPEDDDRMTQAIMNTVLLQKNSDSSNQLSLALGFGSLDELDRDLDAKWESAREKARRHRTIFAQNRLRPEDVMPEWEKAFSVLGTEEDVERFVLRACDRLGAPLNTLKPGGYRAPVAYLPEALQERLDSAGLMGLKTLDFRYPTVSGAEFIHRTHPLVSLLADYIAEQAMGGDQPDLVARTGAIFTQGVNIRSTIYLLRLRSRMLLRRPQQTRELLAEEALALAVEGQHEPRFLPRAEALQLMQAEVSKNMPIERRQRELAAACDALTTLQPVFAELAAERGRELLADHRRVREAADARGEYQVRPQLPVDVLGVYVLVPDVALF